MTTYVYETIPTREGEEPQFFEIKQDMNDAPLTQHPETGQPIKRVIVGGLGVLTKKESAPPPSCGPGCCCG